MKWFLILWVSTSCGGLTDKFVPDTLKASLCPSHIKWALETRPEEALKRAREAGCEAQVLRCKNLRCEEIRGQCRLEVDI